jgi:hypothetical protein
MGSLWRMALLKSNAAVGAARRAGKKKRLRDGRRG